MTTAHTILEILRVLDKITTCAFYLLGGLAASGLIAEWVKNRLRKKSRLNNKTIDSDDTVDSKTEYEMRYPTFDGYTDEITVPIAKDEISKVNCSEEERVKINHARNLARFRIVGSRLLALYVKKIVAMEEELSELFQLFTIKQNIENQTLFTTVTLNDSNDYRDEFYYRKYSNIIALRQGYTVMPHFILGKFKRQLYGDDEAIGIEMHELEDSIYLVSRHYIALARTRNMLIRDYSLIQYHCWQRRNRREKLTDGEKYFAKMYGAKLLARKLELELPKHFEDEHEAQLLKI